MAVSVGTFNLNNLFSRFNFEAEISSLNDLETGITFDGHVESANGDLFKVRTYKGKLVTQKDAEEAAIIAERIKRMNVDVLAVQEVEDREALQEFNSMFLGNMYPYISVIDGNDPRLIDVGIMSKLPLGGLTSWQFTMHPDVPERPIFSRDVFEVEVLDPTRSKKLFTLYNNHLKSNFVDFREDAEAGAKKNNETRKRQAEMLARIIKQRNRPDSAYIVLGDLNDTHDALSLSPLLTDQELGLVNALANPTETQPYKEIVGTTAWTHRFKHSGKPADYELFDQIWLSQKLAEKQQGAFIDRRTLASGDGSDHDPAWVVLEI